MYTVSQNCGGVHVVFYLRIRFTVLGALDCTVVLPKAVLLAVNIFLIDMLLGLSKWRLDSIQSDKSENYEHLRDGLLLHHRSVMLIFNFLPDLGRFHLFLNCSFQFNISETFACHVIRFIKLTGQLSRVSSNAFLSTSSL